VQVYTESARSVRVNSQNSGLKEWSCVRNAQIQHTAEVLEKALEEKSTEVPGGHNK
jgi:hypothetical protein